MESCDKDGPDTTEESLIFKYQYFPFLFLAFQKFSVGLMARKYILKK